MLFWSKAWIRFESSSFFLQGFPHLKSGHSKGRNPQFFKIVFLAKKRFFFSNRRYFYVRLGNQQSVSRGVEMGTFLCRRVKFQKCGLRLFECPLFTYFGFDQLR